MQLAQVILERAVETTHAADPLRLARRSVELGFDFVLGVIAELEAVGAEDLDAVVAIGIV